MTVIKVTDTRTGKEVCGTCYGSGWVDPWCEDVDYICPECRMGEYLSADEYFEVADALELNRERGLSDERVARAEKSHLSEHSFTRRSMEQEFTERKRAAGW